jgi:hypothetical protein
MNPDINELLQRLEDYSKVTYGKNAYGLSVAEAQSILKLIDKLVKNQNEDRTSYFYWETK